MRPHAHLHLVQRALLTHWLSRRAIVPALAAGLVLAVAVPPSPAAPAPRSSPGESALVAEPVPPGTDHNQPYARQGAMGLRIPEGIGLQSAGAVNTFTGSAAIPGYRLAVGPLWALGAIARPALVHNANDPTDGALGPGWTHNLAMRVHDAGDGSGAVVLVGPQGRRERFDLRADGLYAAPRSGTALRAADGGGFVARLSTGVSWTFDVDGRLVRATDSVGRGPVLSYDQSGRLSAVGEPDAPGVDVWFEYDWCFPGRLCALADQFAPYNRAEMAYDAAGRLERITNPLGTSFAYGYDGDSHRLARVTGVDRGVTVELAYDAEGRVQAARDIDDVVLGWQKVFTYTVSPDGSHATVVERQRVGDPGQRALLREDAYTPDGRILLARTYDTRGSGAYRQVESIYDAAGNLREERISSGP